MDEVEDRLSVEFAEPGERMTVLEGDQPAMQSAGGEADERRKARTPRAQGTLQMLLVEDDFSCRLLLQTFLSRYGDCHVAVNGAEAAAAFRMALESGRGYDLVCMDILLPGMDGRETVRQLRELETSHGICSRLGAKIFMTTSVHEIKEVARCFMELCDAYLVKPVDLGKLRDQMEFHQLLARARPNP